MHRRICVKRLDLRNELGLRDASGQPDEPVFYSHFFAGAVLHADVLWAGAWVGGYLLLDVCQLLIPHNGAVTASFRVCAFPH